MPRGKDAPTVTGGQIDPYVQRSMTQSKQQAGDRLIQAMSDSAATSRQQIAGRQTIDRQKLAGDQSMQQQAARLASEDRRSAERLEAEKEDRNYQQFQLESNQAFQSAEAQLRRRFERSLIDQTSKERTADREAMVQMQILSNDQDMHDTAGMHKIIQGVISNQKQNEVAQKKYELSLEEMQTRSTQALDAYSETKKQAEKRIAADNRMNAPYLGKFKSVARLAGAPMGFVSGFTRVRELVPGTIADPMGVLQSLVGDRTKIKVDDLMPSTISNLRDQLVSGEVDQEDIAELRGNVDAMTDSVSVRLRELPKGGEKDFWEDHQDRLILMGNSLSSLSKDKTLIKGKQSETVGRLVRFALGTIDGTNTGSLLEIRRARTEAGFTDVQSGIAEITAGFEPFNFLDITEDMHPLVRQYVDGHNKSALKYQRGDR